MEFENKCFDDLNKLEKEIAETKKRIQELTDLLAELRPIR